MHAADDILSFYGQVIGVVYLCAVGLMAAWEAFFPKRPLVAALRVRWLSHIALFLGGATLVNLLLPVTCVAASLWATEHGWGVGNRWSLPLWFTFLASFLVLDFTRYGAHWLEHRVPWLWRMHRIHHTDHDVDFTTSFRFHPLELLYITLLNVTVIVMLGLPVVAVILYEAVAFFINVFNHGNVRIAPAADRWLRQLLVTPDMHRIHHSARSREYNANFGALLSCWDRWLRTYVATPVDGQVKMKLGLAAYQDQKHNALHWLLINPLLRAAPKSRVDVEDSATATIATDSPSKYPA